MKKRMLYIGLILACIFAWSGFTFAAQVNEIANPGFELGEWDPEGWQFPDKSNCSYDFLWDENDHHGGDRCLKIGRFFDSKLSEYLQWGPEQRFSVNPNKTYLMSFWHKIEPGLYPYALQVRISCYSGQWGYKGNQFWWLDGPATWKKTEILVKDLDVMNGTDNLNISFFLGRTPGWVWIDDCLWREASPEDIRRVQASMNNIDVPEMPESGTKTVMPRGRADAWWHTENINGAWWLVKPDGTAFWSLGIVSLGTRFPAINPDKCHWIMKNYSGSSHLASLDFHNLKKKSWDALRKFTGADFKKFRKAFKAYDRLSIRRANLWGFNTTCSVYHNRGVFYSLKQNREPVPAIVNSLVPSSFQRYAKPDGSMGERPVTQDYLLKDPDAGNANYTYLSRAADPFNETWVRQVDESMRVWVNYDDYCTQKQKDENPFGGNVSDDKLPIMGYFADSEPVYFNAWNHVWSPNCSAEFISRLKAKYGDIRKLNKAWSSRYGKYKFRSFEQIAGKPPRPKWFDDPMLADFLEMERVVFARLTDVTINTMRKYGKGRMALSNRFESRGLGEVMRFMDVMSGYDAICMDLYSTYLVHGLSRAELDVLRIMHEFTGKPVWLTEWSVNGRDTKKTENLNTYQRGWVDTQADRGKVYKNVISTLIHMPFMIGAKFYSWQNFNSPLPSYGFKNYGIVDSHDRPYRDFVDEVKKTNRRAAAFDRSGIKDPFPWKNRGSEGSHEKGINWLLRAKMKRYLR